MLRLAILLLFWTYYTCTRVYLSPAMAPTSDRIAQTSSEAKKQYKERSSLALPPKQQKQYERALVLDERASHIRETNKRRKVMAIRRKEREIKAKAQLQQAGIGQATQLVGYNHTQAQLKRSMEGWVGWRKQEDDRRQRQERELADTTAKLDALARAVDGDVWGLDEAAASVAASSPAETFSDGSLDDETLLQAYYIAALHPTTPGGVLAQCAPVSVHTVAIEAPACSPCRATTAQGPIDVWDDFLDSGTQIARELAADA
jgi:hypothetical protein